MIMNKENEQSEKKTSPSEQMASRLLRLLAIIGLIAVLAIVAWGIVQGVHFLPNVDKNITATVSYVKSIFKKAPEESLMFELDRRTFNVGDNVNLSWTYTGENKPESYLFSYRCGSDIILTAMLDGGWTRIVCGEEIEINGTSVFVVPNNNKERFSDTEITIKGSGLKDSTTISVINKDIYGVSNKDFDKKEDVEDVDKDIEKTSSKSNTENKNTVISTSRKPNIVKNNTPQTKSAGKPTATTEIHIKKPSDLVMNIEETGIMINVSGKTKFFPVSPIPVDKVAGVKFTVTNRGGKKSGGWVFKAELPIEGDSNYKYISPIQEGLAPGMQIEYTLGFDELLNKNNGVIRLEIVPSDSGDKTSNNKDSAILNIDIK